MELVTNGGLATKITYGYGRPTRRSTGRSAL